MVGKARRGVGVLLAAAAAVGVTWSVWAAGTVAERASLKGVKPIRAAVEKLRPDVVSDGLDVSRLRTVMDARLRAAGVPAHRNAPNDLLLVVSTSPQKDGMYAVHLHLELRQLVALFHEFIRDPESRGMAATWRTSWIGILKTDELKQVEPELAKLVDQFTADWQIGNRGRRP